MYGAIFNREVPKFTLRHHLENTWRHYRHTSEDLQNPVYLVAHGNVVWIIEWMFGDLTGVAQQQGLERVIWCNGGPTHVQEYYKVTKGHFPLLASGRELV